MDVVLSIYVPELSNVPFRMKMNKDAKKYRNKKRVYPRGYMVGCVDNNSSIGIGNSAVFYREPFYNYINERGKVQRAWRSTAQDIYPWGSANKPAGVHPLEITGPEYPEDEEAGALGLVIEEHDDKVGYKRKKSIVNNDTDVEETEKSLDESQIRKSRNEHPMMRQMLYDTSFASLPYGGDWNHPMQTDVYGPQPVSYGTYYCTPSLTPFQMFSHMGSMDEGF